MTPTRDPDPLEDRLRQALAQRAATTTVGPPRHDLADPDPASATSDGLESSDADADADAVALAVPTVPSRRTPRWAKPAAAAAAVMLLAGGLFVAGQLADDRDDRTETGTQPGPACGPELPFTFPAPEGFEGPASVPASSEIVGPNWNGVVLRWQGSEGTIDVYWPGLPGDPTTPFRTDEIWAFAISPRQTPDGQWAQQVELQTTALGDDACDSFMAVVTTPDADSTRGVVAQIGLGLVGPDGVAPGPKPTLVTRTTTIDALPDIEPCTPPTDAEDAENYGGTVGDAGTHPTPEEALAYFAPTDLQRLPQGGYVQATLPDGSYAFLFEPDPERAADFFTVAVVVDPVDGGWTVTSWESTGC